MQKAGIKTLQTRFVIMWRPWCLAALSSHAQADIQARGYTAWVHNEFLERYGKHVDNHKFFTRLGGTAHESRASPAASLTLRHTTRLVWVHSLYTALHSYQRAKASLLQAGTPASSRNNVMSTRLYPVMVLSYADLLFRPAYALERLQDFLPEAGLLDIAFRPKLGVDIFPQNEWKAEGSVADYAREHTPESVGYDTRTRTCTIDAGGEEKRRAWTVLEVAKERERAKANLDYLQYYS